MFQLKIVTPNELFFEGQVEHVRVPGAQGSLGILQNHAPLVTPIVAGDLEYRDGSGKTSKLKVEGGFLEVLKNRVLVLTDKVAVG
jgi:F-type H+-transporting ATPase subunit epsilon